MLPWLLLTVFLCWLLGFWVWGNYRFRFRFLSFPFLDGCFFLQVSVSSLVFWPVVLVAKESSGQIGCLCWGSGGLCDLWGSGNLCDKPV